MDQSRLDLDESILNEAEVRDKFPQGSLVQGLNLFGKCTYPECGKKFIVKLGYGKFEIGKKAANERVDNKKYKPKSPPKSLLSEVIDNEFDKIEEAFGVAGSVANVSQMSMVRATPSQGDDQ